MCGRPHITHTSYTIYTAADIHTHTLPVLAPIHCCQMTVQLGGFVFSPPAPAVLLYDNVLG